MRRSLRRWPPAPPSPPAKTRAVLRKEALKVKKKKLVEGRATAKELLEEAERLEKAAAAERLEKAAAAEEEEARRKRTQKSIPDSRSESYDLTASFWKMY
ncbi:hypothetical protein AbraCBS73388_007249 [Aspergillus brasiliensis]|uniref:Uncharacterized protein n=1 Tax=Aspergillus brasiliensis TaxID=319629 RepID=A0A9W6DJN9_9EURO|nr:hypothetical protein AbraCBS73388_007249 [Aspergillus brasiliensis]